MGIPCQDASLVVPHRTSTDNLLILVAADGAGSAARSNIGAALACSQLSTSIIRYVDNEGSLTKVTTEVTRQWIGEIVELLRIKAFEEEAQLRDYACTILGVAISGEAALFLQVGDGAIVVGRNGTYEPVFWPTQGEYANATVFVTDERLAEALQFIRFGEVPEEVAVFTDGLQCLALRFATKEAHGPFFSPLFSRLAEEDTGESCNLRPMLIDWLGSPHVTSRTDDDKTLMLATRRSARVVGPELA
jgi:hypothetical protein